jgi:hypothetical protein
MTKSNIFVLIAAVVSTVLSWVGHTFPQYAGIVQLLAPLVALLGAQLSHQTAHAMGVNSVTKSSEAK